MCFPGDKSVWVIPLVFTKPLSLIMMCHQLSSVALFWLVRSFISQRASPRLLWRRDGTDQPTNQPAHLRRQSPRCYTCYFLQMKTDTVNGGWIVTGVLVQRGRGAGLFSPVLQFFGPWTRRVSWPPVQTHLISASPLCVSEEVHNLFLPQAAPPALSLKSIFHHTRGVSCEDVIV